MSLNNPTNRRFIRGHFLKALLAASLTVFVFSTSAIAKPDQPSQARPYWPTKGWKTGKPESHGLDPDKLKRAIDHIENNTAAWSILIIKDGFLVAEKYFRSGRVDKVSGINSATKSVTSTVFGIAVDKGLISIDQTLQSVFPEYITDESNDILKELTFKHALAMTWGFKWKERNHYFEENSDFWRWYKASDWVGHALARKHVFSPGSTWIYDSSASHLLSAAITKVAEEDTADFAQKHLFTPIGIPETGISGRVSWRTTRKYTPGGFGISLTAREMAKFGYLMLNDGYWDGKQIVSKQWVQEATSAHSPRDFGGGYGYQWWTVDDTSDYFAAGFGGQYIFIIPEHDLLFVTTAQNSIQAIAGGSDCLKPNDIYDIYRLIINSVDNE